jgi:putative oxidoreductase
MKKCFRCFALPTGASIALLLLRLVAGSAFLIHGWGKMQAPMSWMGPDAPVPGLLQLLATISEFGGGIALILGLLTPLGALGIAMTMAVATSMHAFVMKDPFVATAPGQGAFELPLVYFAVALTLITVGPGRFSLDWKIFGQK